MREIAADRQRRGIKLCPVCQSEKPLQSFTKRKVSPDGLNYKCRDCNASIAAKWREANPGAYGDWYAEHREERSVAYRDWRAEKKDHLSQYNSRWARENKHIVNAIIARRTAAKFNATPAWANDIAIREIYKKASDLTKATGIPHEVDHIYPLQGKTVCGLHCEANLQILTKFENLSKGNKLPEDYAASSRNKRMSRKSVAA